MGGDDRRRQRAGAGQHVLVHAAAAAPARAAQRRRRSPRRAGRRARAGRRRQRDQPRHPASSSSTRWRVRRRGVADGAAGAGAAARRAARGRPYRRWRSSTSDAGHGRRRRWPADPRPTPLAGATAARDAELRSPALPRPTRGAGCSTAWLTKPVRRSHLYERLADARSRRPRTRAPARTRPAPPAHGRDGSRRARVLVAEDNAVNQRCRCACSSALGCSVDVAANGREASRRSERLRYDLVLMDCQMPEMDGYEATAASVG